MIKRKIDLVYGGGNVGLMGIIANKIYQNGGKVIGIIPKSLTPKELSGQSIGELIITKGMHERKIKMYSLGDAFIALPGGFGTFEELLETITWQQLGIHSKPIGLLNINNFYDPLLKLIQNGIIEGFINKKFAENILVIDDEPKKLLDKLFLHITPKSDIKWLHEDEI
jgi:uncharacterized protein (TIGR00730 family)